MSPLGVGRGGHFTRSRGWARPYVVFLLTKCPSITISQDIGAYLQLARTQMELYVVMVCRYYDYILNIIIRLIVGNTGHSITPVVFLFKY